MSETLSGQFTKYGWPTKRGAVEPVRALISSLAPARDRGYLTSEEFNRICSLKSARRADLFKGNRSGDIEAVTALAFSHDIESDAVRIGLLTALAGVQVPRASAILAWTFPERWAVIDRRSWATLSHLGHVTPSRPVKRYAAEPQFVLGVPQYVKFLSILRPESKLAGVTPAELDQWLYACDLPENVGFI